MPYLYTGLRTVLCFLCIGVRPSLSLWTVAYLNFQGYFYGGYIYILSLLPFFLSPLLFPFNLFSFFPFTSLSSSDPTAFILFHFFCYLCCQLVTDINWHTQRHCFSHSSPEVINCVVLKNKPPLSFHFKKWIHILEWLFTGKLSVSKQNAYLENMTIEFSKHQHYSRV